MQLDVFMIRNGLFGQDYGMKLVLALVGLTICLVFWHRTKKRDYLAVFLTGVVVWSCFEILITVLSIRYIEDAILFGFDLHWLPASVLRGASEGSVVALVGITAGDFIPNRETRRYAIPAAILLLGFFVARTLLTGLPVRAVGETVLSRREVFAWPSVLFFMLILAFNLFWYFRASDVTARTRARNMFVAILVFSAIWSIAQYVANVRWIEIGILQAVPVLEILVFAWDIIFEVAMCYVSFYTIPQHLGFLTQEQL
ncbi:MAG: hypothetical protein ACXAC0_03245 [Candidatus Thorarchaeota archaeon]